MSNFKEEQIKKHLELNQTFNYLLSNHLKDGYDEKTIQLLKQNYDMMRSTLIDLGVKFDEIEKIRNLNMRIRELENVQDNPDMSFIKVSTYINGLSSKLKDVMRNIGVNGSFNVTFEPNLKFNIRFYSSGIEKASRSSFVKEDDYNRYNEENRIRHEKFMDEFETVKWSNSYYLKYSEANINKILIEIEDSFDVSISNHEYDVKSHFEDTDNNDEHPIKTRPIIESLTATVYTLQSSIGLAEAFRNRY